MAEHPAEVVEVRLGSRSFTKLGPPPLVDELLRCHQRVGHSVPGFKVAIRGLVASLFQPIQRQSNEGEMGWQSCHSTSDLGMALPPGRLRKVGMIVEAEGHPLRSPFAISAPACPSDADRPLRLCARQGSAASTSVLHALHGGSLWCVVGRAWPAGCYSALSAPACPSDAERSLREDG